MTHVEPQKNRGELQHGDLGPWVAEVVQNIDENGLMTKNEKVEVGF